MDLAERLRADLGNRYAIERELGRGGMAIVFLGEDRKHGRKVAIKVLRPELAAAIGSERFQREIEIAAPLVHPHILPLYGSGEAGELLFYVMPFVPGESLRERLARQGRLPLEEALKIAREVADGLEYAHRQGVIHRDIKPDNILLTESHAIISDFGVARAVAESGARGLTASGHTLGTPAYMSPEQAWGEGDVDARSDVYSLGCVLYEMLAGEPPFGGADARPLLVRKTVDTAPSLRAARADVPLSIAQAVGRALSRTPADRFASAGEFAETLHAHRPALSGEPAAVPSAGAGWRSWFTGWHRVGLVIALLAVVGTAIAVFRAQVLEPGSAYAVPNPRQSFVVLPFESRAPTPEEERLAATAADELTRQLNGWESARAVPNVALTGPMFDLGLSGITLSRLEDGITVARSVRVGTLVALTVRVRGDTALLDAHLYDVATSEPLTGSPIQSRAFPKTDAYALVVPVANATLGLSGAPEALETLRRQSNVPGAIDQFQEGLRSLGRWRLGEAEDHFRQAIDQDSTFALGHHYLALTYYWETARDRNRQGELGPRIAQLSGTARRLASSLEPNALTPAHAAHIRAFARFQGGDYDGARATYRELLARDSTDVYAWLLLGSVEFADPWLAGRTEEEWRPRQNLNLAVRAFTETVRLSPDFFLGYGHVFDIYRKLAAAIHQRVAYLFERPGGGAIPPWGTRSEPGRAVPFYPTMLDSIGWVARPNWSVGIGQRSLAGVDSLRRSAIRQLERWAAYAPEEPRPREELAAWALLERRSPTGSETAADLRRLTRRALGFTAAALALKGDTTPEDRVRLAGLYLAVDSLELAAELTKRALADFDEARSTMPTARPPRAAANVFLARGQPSRAVEILAPWWAIEARAVDDTVRHRTIPYGGAEPIVGRLRVYGATALGGEPLRATFAELNRIWSEPRYPRREASLLRAYGTRWVGPALTLERGILTEWFRDQTEIAPAWEGYLLLVDADSAAARRALERGVAELRGRSPSVSTSHLLGVLAQRLGEDSLAVELFRRADGWPLAVTGFDPGWGLRSLSYLHRARSLEASGDAVGAIRAYARFEQMWADAEPELQPLLLEARQARRRLRRGE